jgi:hypothetical protein
MGMLLRAAANGPRVRCSGLRYGQRGVCHIICIVPAADTNAATDEKHGKDKDKEASDDDASETDAAATDDGTPACQLGFEDVYCIVPGSSQPHRPQHSCDCD